MARILVCIPSGQAIPNLVSIIHYKPEKIIFLKTTMAEKFGFDDKILDSLVDRGLTFPKESIFKVYVANENSILELQNALASTLSFFSTSDELIVNITGGTKPMSIATYNYFSTRVANIVYILNNDKTLNCKNDQEENIKLDPPLTCKQFLLAHGFDLTIKKQNAHASNSIIMNVIRWIAANFGNKDLINFEDAKEKSIFRDRGGDLDKISWNSEVSKEIISRISDTQKEWPETKKLWGRVLTGEWLEIFIWDILVRNKDYLKIHDIQLGPVARQIGAKNDKKINQVVQNELDIAFMKGTKLNFIECKSGAQNHSSNSKQDVFYKIESIKNQFGALQVYSHLASSSSNILDENHNILESVQIRADLYNCKIISSEIIIELAKASSVEDECKILAPFI